jgi:glycosyltransferase involved in cell wall biosynthesis
MSRRKFSVILPVRNGMPHIIDAVSSVLNQTFDNFELHILDNKSTDGTLEWCKSIDDVRVKVSVSNDPLNIEDSWGRIANIDKSEFITMFAHDDILFPEFLENIDGLIRKYPDAKLYQTNGELIDNKGSLIRECRPINEVETSHAYLKARFSSNRDVFGTGYVMRAEAYDRLGGIPKFNKLSFADDALWLMLIDDGYKACCKLKSFQVRIHENSTSATNPSNWFGFLVAIKQFAEFLEKFHQERPSSIIDLVDLQKRFFKQYLINIYILGLVHHAEQGIDFPSEDLSLFIDTYKSLSGSSFASMICTPKVLPVFIISKICRPLLPLAWRVYQSFRAS